MLSNTSEYALRIMTMLAQQCTGSFLRGEEIAAETKVPAAYLAKILQSLNRAGLVLTQKGIGGGYVLNRPPDKISLFDIVIAVDSFKRISKCPLGITNHEMLCPLHHKLDHAYADFQKSLENCLLSDFLSQKQQVLCKNKNDIP